MGIIKVETKPEQKLLRCDELLDMRTYRVVQFDTRDLTGTEADTVLIGDVLVCIRGYFNNQHCILNASRGRNITGWQYLSRIKCVREFTTKSVQLYFDENELPT